MRAGSLILFSLCPPNEGYEGLLLLYHVVPIMEKLVTRLGESCPNCQRAFVSMPPLSALDNIYDDVVLRLEVPDLVQDHEGSLQQPA